MTSPRNGLLDAIAAVTLASSGDTVVLIAEINRQIRAGLGLPPPEQGDGLSPGGPDLASMIRSAADPVAAVEAYARVAGELTTKLSYILAIAGWLAQGDTLTGIGLRLAYLPEGDA